MVIAEAARLRRTAARAGDLVPVRHERILTRNARARIRIDDHSPRKAIQPDARAVRRRKLERWHGHVAQMRRRPVVDGRRQVRRQHVRIVRAHRPKQAAVLWLLSQNGFVLDSPQRQRTIVPSFECADVSISLPSASTRRTSPLTLYGPFSRTLISTVILRRA